MDVHISYSHSFSVDCVFLSFLRLSLFPHQHEGDDGGKGDLNIKVEHSDKIESQDDNQTSGDEVEQLRFKDYLEKAFKKRADNLLDLEAFMLTSYILDNNSDFHVMWNFRREILLHWKTAENVNDILNLKIGPSREYFEGYDDYELFSILDSVKATLNKSTSGKINLDKIFIAELSFTTKCLTRHLKSYATWHHRTKIIQWMGKPPLQSELDACTDFFTLDPRNFHCWNYRKFICELLYGHDDGMANQLNFIKSMIKRNPDNFSAFHYQSVLLNQLKERGLLGGGDASSPEYQQIWNDQFNSIKPSLLNIASLQGLWLYFWWLCLMRFDMHKSESLRSSSPLVYRIILDADTRTLVYQFTQCLRTQPFNQITLISTSGTTSNHTINEWQSIGPITSDLWYHQVDESIDCGNISEVMFTYSDETHLTKLPPLDELNLSVSTINELPKSRFDLIRQTQSTDWINEIGEQSNEVTSQVIMETNRYFTLTKALLSGESCRKSITIDPLRRNFYDDIQSRHTIEDKLRENPSESQLNLQNLSLTCIHPTSRLTHLRSLDLSNNQLIRINGSFNSLISLQSMNLDNNQISMIDPSFKMISLKTLSLKHNKLTEKSSIKSCNNCEQLKVIVITGNPIVSYNQSELQIAPHIHLE